MLDSRKHALATILAAATALGLSDTAKARAIAPTERLTGRLPRHLRGLGEPGKSPALSGPHSERMVHVRGANGVHHWFTIPQWRALRPGHFGQPGDLIERVNGYGQVTKRVRVAT
jgi:hypothetical protein